MPGYEYAILGTGWLISRRISREERHDNRRMIRGIGLMKSNNGNRGLGLGLPWQSQGQPHVVNPMFREARFVPNPA